MILEKNRVFLEHCIRIVDDPPRTVPHFLTERDPISLLRDPFSRAHKPRPKLPRTYKNLHAQCVHYLNFIRGVPILPRYSINKVFTCVVLKCNRDAQQIGNRNTVIILRSIRNRK